MPALPWELSILPGPFPEHHVGKVFFILYFLSPFLAAVGSKACLPVAYSEGRSQELYQHGEPSFGTGACVKVVRPSAHYAAALWSTQACPTPPCPGEMISPQ